GLPLVGAPGRDDLWRWQVGNRSNSFGRIGSIRTRTEHGFILPRGMLGPKLYDKCPSSAIPKPGKDAIVSENRPHCRRLSGPTLQPCKSYCLFYFDLLRTLLIGQ